MSAPSFLPPLQLGIYEAFKVKGSALMSATEAAEMILRVGAGFYDARTTPHYLMLPPSAWQGPGVLFQVEP